MLHVAVARIPDAPALGGDGAPGWMGESERRRWAGLSPAARRGFAASRALLRDLLGAATGVAQGDWDVSAEPGTAPVARTPRADVASGAIRASLSHRLGWVAAAVSRQSVGVDIECDRAARADPDERAALMLSAAELPAWRALARDARESALLTCWTAKEAWFKASPAGAAAWDFRQVVARACPPELANVRVWESPPLHLAVCCADAVELGRVECEGVDTAAATSSYWHVARAAVAV